MPVISAVPTKLASFQIGATVYGFSNWSLKFTLETGEIKHFNAQSDANGNYWPTIISNFASGTGEAGGSVDHSGNAIPIGAGLYINSSGTVTCLHMTGDGFTAPIVITDNDSSSNTSDTDGAKRSISFKLTGPPTRVYIL